MLDSTNKKRSYPPHAWREFFSLFPPFQEVCISEKQPEESDSNSRKLKELPPATSCHWFEHITKSSPKPLFPNSSTDTPESCQHTLALRSGASFQISPLADVLLHFQLPYFSPPPLPPCVLENPTCKLHRKQMVLGRMIEQILVERVSHMNHLNQQRMSTFLNTAETNVLKPKLPHICNPLSDYVDVSDVKSATAERRTSMLCNSIGNFLRNVPKFRVMSYNILAPSFIDPNKHHPNQHRFLGWNYRCNQLLYDITRAVQGERIADIIALQEMELRTYRDFFLPSLGERGFQGHFTQRREEKAMDGCALFWAVDTFMKVGYSSTAISALAVQKVPPFPHMHPDMAALWDMVVNLGTILDITWLRHIQTNQVVMVCNTHLHYDPHYPEVKSIQMALCLQYIEDIHLAAQRPPILFCGDLNSVPIKYGSDAFDGMVNPVGGLESGVLELLTKGSLGITHPHHPYSRRSWDSDCGDGVKPQPPAENIGIVPVELPISQNKSDVCRDMSRHMMYPHFMAEQASDWLRATFRHTIPMKCAMCEIQLECAAWTTHTSHFTGTLDYIFYRGEGIMQAVGILAVSPQIPRHPIPDGHHASDHIPIVAEFALLNQTNNVTPNQPWRLDDIVLQTWICLNGYIEFVEESERQQAEIQVEPEPGPHSPDPPVNPVEITEVEPFQSLFGESDFPPLS